MNKTIACILLALMSSNVSIFSQGNNRQTATDNAQSSVLFYHTVERGETVYSISRTYNVDTTDIHRLNPGSAEVIKVGQRLKIPQAKPNDDERNEFIYHTIQPKETLYSLSRKYQIRAEYIMEANPGLSESTFQIGKNIRIPVSQAQTDTPEDKPAETKYTEYKVKKRETMFGILRMFDVTEPELLAANPDLKKGLKEGMTLRIPAKEHQAESPAKEMETNSLLNVRTSVDKVDTIKLAVLLPFMLDEKNLSPNTARFVEYYEGILLAVDSLQRNGLTIKLITRDTGYGIRKLQDILKEKAMEEAHLIIGGIDNEQIDQINSFAHKRNIKYIIPFTSKNDEVRAHANIFQVNTPHHYLLSQAAIAAISIFKDYNFIFVDTKDPDDKLEFIGLIKQELSQRNIFFRDLSYGKDFQNDLEKLIRTDKRNLIIPMSGKAECLNKIKPSMRAVAEKLTEAKINLFGYPEWQSNMRANMEDLFVLDTYIYSNFYADAKSAPVSKFQTKYKLFYSKTPNSYPNFSMLGFDTSLFFLDAIGRYGLSFETQLDKLSHRGLQMALRFKRANDYWGGFMNTGLFIIHFDKDNAKIQWQEIKQ